MRPRWPRPQAGVFRSANRSAPATSSGRSVTRGDPSEREFAVEGLDSRRIVRTERRPNTSACARQRTSRGFGGVHVSRRDHHRAAGDRHRPRLGLLWPEAVHDPAAALGILLRPRRRRPVGRGHLRSGLLRDRPVVGHRPRLRRSSSRRSRSSGTTPRSSSSAAPSATRWASASSNGWASTPGFIIVVIGLIVGAVFAVGDVRAGRPGPAGHGLLRVQRGGRRRQRRPDPPRPDQARRRSTSGHLRVAPDQRHPRHRSLFLVLGVAALFWQIRDVGTRSRRSTGARTATSSPWKPRSLVAAIDQGTTSSRCILFDRAGQPVASHQLEHAQITPRPGWVEHDADEILERVRTCVRVALRDIGADAARARRGRHQRPARDDRRLGPADRPPGPPRDRLAGHPDRRRRRRGWPPPTRPARTGSGPDRAADLDLFLGAQARLDPRRRRAGAAGGRRGRRPAVRDHRHVAHLAPDRRRRRAAST